MENADDVEVNVLRKVRGVEGLGQFVTTGRFPGSELKFIIMQKLGFNLK